MINIRLKCWCLKNKRIFIAIFLSCVLYGEGNSCKETLDCIRTIDCGFTNDTKTVKIRHRTSSGKEETVAVCDWIAGGFACAVAGGYRVNITSPTTFNISIGSGVTCPNGNFTFSSNGNKQITCSVDSIKGEGEASEPKEQVETGCPENTEAAPANTNRFKRSTGSICLHNPPYKDTSGNSWIVPVVVSTVANVLILITVIGVLYLRRRKRERKKEAQETGEVKVPLI